MQKVWRWSNFYIALPHYSMEDFRQQDSQAMPRCAARGIHNSQTFEPDTLLPMGRKWLGKHKGRPEFPLFTVLSTKSGQ